MVQVGDLKNQFVIDWRDIKTFKPTDVAEFISILNDKDKEKHGVNLAYDYKIMKHHLGIEMTNLKDSMIAEMILKCGLSFKKGRYSLAGMTKKYLGWEFNSPQMTLFNPIASKETRTEFVTIGDAPFNLRQVEYGAGDVIWPLLIWDKQVPQIEEFNL